MDERDIISRLRRSASDPAARGLSDDVALLDGLVITHDCIAEGVHYLPEDPPASVGWKLVAVNLSDLAAKGATPAGALLAMTLASNDDWDARFLDGVEAACESYSLPLIGGDTIALRPGTPRVLGLTAIGRAGANVPSRSGARPGDRLWLIGTVGDSAAGLALLLGNPKATGTLVDIYRRPVPLLAAGKAIAPQARATMDVSDGLLLDASRMAEASGCSLQINLDQVPVSDVFRAERGVSRGALMFAATGGDDYALLAALPPETDASTLPLPSGTTIRCIGTFAEGDARLALTFEGQVVELPEKLGHEHRSNPDASMADRH